VFYPWGLQLEKRTRRKEEEREEKGERRESPGPPYDFWAI